MITPADRERRRQHIGSSDVPAILGASPWATGADVYFAKVEGIDPVETDSMAFGNAVEPYILSEAEKKLGTLVRNVHRVAPNPIIAVNLDAAVIDLDLQRVEASSEWVGEPVEAKQVGLLSRWPQYAGEWGEEGTDEIPEHVILQVQTQLYATGAKVGHVAALIAQRGLCMFRVEANQTLIGLIVERCERFWKDNVQKRVRPDWSMPSLDVARLIKKQPGKTISIPPETVQLYLDAKRAEKEAAEAVEQAQAALLTQMGDAQVGTSKAGTAKFTTYTRKAYTVGESTVRSVRVTPAKETALAL